MQRVLAGVLAAMACACAPNPVRMPAAEAGEVLERFAAGSGADVCTPQGRATLRGAVRAYGAELNANGVAWPALPGSEGELTRTEVNVVIAFAAGFVEASDFTGPARRMIGQLSVEEWPQLRNLRAAAGIACAEAVELQRAAARAMLETERYTQMMAGAPDRERLQRQALRVERARIRMDDVAAVIDARMRESARS